MDEERKRKQAGEEKKVQEGDSNFYQKKNNQEATFAESKAGGRTGASKKLQPKVKKTNLTRKFRKSITTFRPCRGCMIFIPKPFAFMNERGCCDRPAVREILAFTLMRTSSAWK